MRVLIFIKVFCLILQGLPEFPASLLGRGVPVTVKGRSFQLFTLPDGKKVLVLVAPDGTEQKVQTVAKAASVAATVKQKNAELSGRKRKVLLKIKAQLIRILRRKVNPSRYRLITSKNGVPMLVRNRKRTGGLTRKQVRQLIHTINGFLRKGVSPRSNPKKPTRNHSNNSKVHSSKDIENLKHLKLNQRLPSIDTKSDIEGKIAKTHITTKSASTFPARNTVPVRIDTAIVTTSPRQHKGSILEDLQKEETKILKTLKTLKVSPGNTTKDQTNPTFLDNLRNEEQQILADLQALQGSSTSRPAISTIKSTIETTKNQILVADNTQPSSKGSKTPNKIIAFNVPVSTRPQVAGSFISTLQREEKQILQQLNKLEQGISDSKIQMVVPKSKNIGLREAPEKNMNLAKLKQEERMIMKNLQKLRFQEQINSVDASAQTVTGKDLTRKQNVREPRTQQMHPTELKPIPGHLVTPQPIQDRHVETRIDRIIHSLNSLLLPEEKALIVQLLYSIQTGDSNMFRDRHNQIESILYKLRNSMDIGDFDHLLAMLDRSGHHIHNAVQPSLQQITPSPPVTTTKTPLENIYYSVLTKARLNLPKNVLELYDGVKYLLSKREQDDINILIMETNGNITPTQDRIRAVSAAAAQAAAHEVSGMGNSTGGHALYTELRHLFNPSRLEQLVSTVQVQPQIINNSGTADSLVSAVQNILNSQVPSPGSTNGVQTNNLISLIQQAMAAKSSTPVQHNIPAHNTKANQALDLLKNIVHLLSPSHQQQLNSIFGPQFPVHGIPVHQPQFGIQRQMANMGAFGMPMNPMDSLLMQNMLLGDTTDPPDIPDPTDPPPPKGSKGQHPQQEVEAEDLPPTTTTKAPPTTTNAPATTTRQPEKTMEVPLNVQLPVRQGPLIPMINPPVIGVASTNGIRDKNIMQKYNVLDARIINTRVINDGQSMVHIIPQKSSTMMGPLSPKLLRAFPAMVMKPSHPNMIQGNQNTSPNIIGPLSPSLIKSRQYQQKLEENTAMLAKQTLPMGHMNSNVKIPLNVDNSFGHLKLKQDSTRIKIPTHVPMGPVFRRNEPKSHLRLLPNLVSSEGIKSGSNNAKAVNVKDIYSTVQFRNKEDQSILPPQIARNNFNPMFSNGFETQLKAANIKTSGRIDKHSPSQRLVLKSKNSPMTQDNKRSKQIALPLPTGKPLVLNDQSSQVILPDQLNPHVKHQDDETLLRKNLVHFKPPAIPLVLLDIPEPTIPSVNLEKSPRDSNMESKWPEGIKPDIPLLIKANPIPVVVPKIFPPTSLPVVHKGNQNDEAVVENTESFHSFRNNQFDPPESIYKHTTESPKPMLNNQQVLPIVQLRPIQRNSFSYNNQARDTVTFVRQDKQIVAGNPPPIANFINNKINNPQFVPTNQVNDKDVFVPPPNSHAGVNHMSRPPNPLNLRKAPALHDRNLIPSTKLLGINTKLDTQAEDTNPDFPKRLPPMPKELREPPSPQSPEELAHLHHIQYEMPMKVMEMKDKQNALPPPIGTHNAKGVLPPLPGHLKVPTMEFMYESFPRTTRTNLDQHQEEQPVNLMHSYKIDISDITTTESPVQVNTLPANLRYGLLPDKRSAPSINSYNMSMILPPPILQEPVHSFSAYSTASPNIHQRDPLAVGWITKSAQEESKPFNAAPLPVSKHENPFEIQVDAFHNTQSIPNNLHHSSAKSVLMTKTVHEINNQPFVDGKTHQFPNNMPALNTNVQSGTEMHEHLNGNSLYMTHVLQQKNPVPVFKHTDHARINLFNTQSGHGESSVQKPPVQVRDDSVILPLVASSSPFYNFGTKKGVSEGRDTVAMETPIFNIPQKSFSFSGKSEPATGINQNIRSLENSVLPKIPPPPPAKVHPPLVTELKPSKIGVGVFRKEHFQMTHSRNTNNLKRPFKNAMMYNKFEKQKLNSETYVHAVQSTIPPPPQNESFWNKLINKISVEAPHVNSNDGRPPIIHIHLPAPEIQQTTKKPTTVPTTHKTTIEFEPIEAEDRTTTTTHATTRILPKTTQPPSFRFQNNGAEAREGIYIEQEVPKLEDVKQSKVSSVQKPVSEYEKTNTKCTPKSPTFYCEGIDMFHNVKSIEAWCVGKCVQHQCVTSVCNCSCKEVKKEEDSFRSDIISLFKGDNSFSSDVMKIFKDLHSALLSNNNNATSRPGTSVPKSDTIRPSENYSNGNSYDNSVQDGNMDMKSLMTSIERLIDAKLQQSVQSGAEEHEAEDIRPNQGGQNNWNNGGKSHSNGEYRTTNNQAENQHSGNYEMNNNGNNNRNNNGQNYNTNNNNAQNNNWNNGGNTNNNGQNNNWNNNNNNNGPSNSWNNGPSNNNWNNNNNNNNNNGWNNNNGGNSWNNNNNNNNGWNNNNNRWNNGPNSQWNGPPPWQQNQGRPNGWFGSGGGPPPWSGGGGGGWMGGNSWNNRPQGRPPFWGGGGGMWGGGGFPGGMWGMGFGRRNSGSGGGGEAAD